MRFADLPPGAVSDRGRWAHWEDLRLYLPPSEDNPKLRLVAPELDWHVDAHGVYSFHFDDAVELFAELLELPVVKDPTWAGVWRFWRRVPGPLAMWRAWLLVRAHMREAHWAPTTAAGFAARLVALKADVPAEEQDGFVLLGSDFIRLHDAFNSTVELHWTAPEVVSLQWLSGLVWERDSLADSNGSLRPWKLLIFLGGAYFTDAQLRSGASFHRNLMTATAWAARQPSAVGRVFTDDAITAAEMLSLSSHVMRLLDDLVLPDLFRVHTKLGFARDAQLHTLIRYADSVLNSRPLDWIVDMVSMHIVAMLPSHRAVLGPDMRRWPEARFNMISRRIAAARTTSGHALPTLDEECILANESFLLVRVPQAEAWAAEARYDASGAPLGRKYSADELFRKVLAVAAPSEKDQFSDSGQTFTAQARLVKLEASYQGIKKDYKELVRTRATSDSQLQLLLQGSTAAAPGRRNNAVTLSMLWDSARKLDAIDPELTSIHELMDNGLPQLLGFVTNASLGYPTTVVVQLFALAKLVSAVGSIAENPAALDLHALAVLPCRRKRFPKRTDHEVFPRPYSTLAGLTATLDTVVDLFDLLGVPDDGGKEEKLNLSPRSLWKVLMRAHRDFGAADPLLIGKATEGVVLGVFSDFFKFHYDPVRSARNAKAAPPAFLVPGTSTHVDGLHTLLARLSRSTDRASDESVDVDTIPGSRFLPSDSPPSAPPSPPDASASSSKRTAAAAAVDDDDAAAQKKARAAKDATEKARQKKAADASVKWRNEAALALSDDGSVLSVGHAKYNVGKMLDDMVSSKVIAAEDKDFVDMASLVASITSPGREVDTSPMYPDATIRFSDDDARTRGIRKAVKLSSYRLDFKPSASGKGKGKGKGKDTGGRGGGRGGRQAGAGAGALVVAAGAPAGADASPSPPPSAPGAQWQQDVSNHITSLQSTPFTGFQVAGVAHALTFITLMSVMQSPFAPDVAVVGDRSGKVTQHLLQRGEKVLAIDPLDSPLPGLRYKGLAEDVLPHFHFKGIFSFLPCDDDATAGSQYFHDKVHGARAGLTYWSLFQNVCVWCADADAVFLEHPKTLLEKWRPPTQILQPFFFGVDDVGDPERKTTPVWIRGWPKLRARFLFNAPVLDKRHALKIHDPAERSKRRSELSWSFADAIAASCNFSTLAPTPRPVLADELRRLDEWFVSRFGESALPLGHGNLQWLLPPDMPLPPHRAEPRAAAIAFSGAPVPQWPPTLFYYDPPAAPSDAAAVAVPSSAAAASMQSAPPSPRNTVADDALESEARPAEVDLMDCDVLAAASGGSPDDASPSREEQLVKLRASYSMLGAQLAASARAIQTAGRAAAHAAPHRVLDNRKRRAPDLPRVAPVSASRIVGSAKPDTTTSAASHAGEWSMHDVAPSGTSSLPCISLTSDPHHSRLSVTWAPGVVSSEHDTRSTPAISGAGEWGTRDVATCGAPSRSCISLTSDPHPSHPADPEHQAHVAPEGTSDGVDRSVQSADAPKTSGALSRLTSHTLCSTQACPTEHARRTSAPRRCHYFCSTTPDMAAPHHTMRRCARDGGTHIRRGAVELASTPPRLVASRGGRTAASHACGLHRRWGSDADPALSRRRPGTSGAVRRAEWLGALQRRRSSSC